MGVGAVVELSDSLFHFLKEGKTTFSLNCKRYAVTVLFVNQNRLPKSKRN